jgi:hypothetical protein
MDVLEGIASRVRAVPGVSNATLLVAPPFQSTGLDVAYSLPGEAPLAATDRAMVDGLGADATYFSTLGVPIRKGRAFTDDDRENSAHVAIVDEQLARTVWPEQDPIGKQIGLGTDMHTVVGVVGETRYRDLLAPRQSLYIPYRQAQGWGPSYLAVRTARDPALLGPSLRTAVHDADPHIVVSRITTFDDRVDAATAQPKLNALLLAGFAISILLLTAVGLYSIAATYVRQRELEIAVRVALGSTPREVVALVLAQGASVVFVGATIGALAALAGAGILGSIVYGVQERDPLVFGLSLASVAAAALVAFFVPARRASRTNPAEVLRAG